MQNPIFNPMKIQTTPNKSHLHTVRTLVDQRRKIEPRSRSEPKTKHEKKQQKKKQNKKDSVKNQTTKKTGRQAANITAARHETGTNRPTTQRPKKKQTKNKQTKRTKNKNVIAVDDADFFFLVPRTPPPVPRSASHWRSTEWKKNQRNKKKQSKNGAVAMAFSVEMTSATLDLVIDSYGG